MARGKVVCSKSYKTKKDGKSFLHISLAHFKPHETKGSKIVITPEVENTKDTKSKPVESILEGKILNQLIHQINPERIPQTLFKVKQKINPKRIFAIALGIVLSLIPTMHFFFFYTWVSIFEGLNANWLRVILAFTTHSGVRIVSGTIFLGCLLLFLSQMIKLQKSNNLFKKISVEKFEIEIFNNQDDSYFDKYLNEVLYLFEQADADVIVFEDIDRFEANEIFIRLREINTLVNAKRKNTKSKYKPLRFFYLLRDDVFESNDRTKFFDFILPIVPVIDSSNAYDQFITHFPQTVVFNPGFLKKLSLYIDDMRILKNIANEFTVYKEKLHGIKLDSDKLLAIITYKNLFLHDFGELQLNRGFVYALLSKAKTIELERLNSLITLKQNEIKELQEELLCDSQELDDVFEAKDKRIPTSYYYSEKQEKLKNEYDNEKQNRKNLIDARCEKRIAAIENEIALFEIEMARIKSMRRLCDVITRDNEDAIFSNISRTMLDYKKIKENPYFGLLKFLISRGHIDENYHDYMVYFLGKSLCNEDKIFLRSVAERKKLGFSYELKNKELVINELSLEDFDEEEILNFSLLAHLLKTTIFDKHIVRSDAQLECFVKQLRNTKNFHFIVSFLLQEYSDSSNEYSETILRDFVKLLNGIWPELFSLAIKENALPAFTIHRYSLLTLYTASKEQLEVVNIDNCLSAYISSQAYYLALLKPERKKLIENFIALAVSFTSIDAEIADRDLLVSVYKNSFPNAENDVRHGRIR